MIKNTRIMRNHRVLYAIAVAGAAILGALLMTGCASGSGADRAGQIMQEYPWLAPLGLSFIESLLAQYGSNLIGLLIAAAAALLG
jgi:hypothetical protein